MLLATAFVLQKIREMLTSRNQSRRVHNSRDGPQILWRGVIGKRSLHDWPPDIQNLFTICPEINSPLFLYFLFSHAPQSQGSPELAECKAVFHAPVEVATNLEQLIYRVVNCAQED